MNKYLCPDCNHELECGYQDSCDIIYPCGKCKSEWREEDLKKHKEKLNLQKKIEFLEKENEKLKKKFASLGIPTEEEFNKNFLEHVEKRLEEAKGKIDIDAGDYFVIQLSFYRKILTQIIKNFENENHF